MGKNKLPGIHESFWIATTPKTNYKTLQKDLKVDVAIIGGGIVGITSAYLLSRQGKKVAVIESRKIIEGVTGYTTAKITSLHDIIYRYLIGTFGKEKAFIYGDAQEEAIRLIKKLVKENNINCDFTIANSYTYAEKEEGIDDIKKEVEAAKSIGLPAFFEESSELPFPIKGAVRFANQAHFHPRKYLLALTELIFKKGSFIFENTKALDVKEGRPCEVITDKGKILAEDVIVASHYPVIDKGKPYVDKLTPKRSYVLEVKIKGEVPKGMYISLEQPFFSVRPASLSLGGPQPSEKGDVLIITGDEHKTGQDNNTMGCFLELEKRARKYFKVESINYNWSTQDNYSLDRIPYIGKYNKDSKHLYTATGFCGWGMTSGTLSAMILSDIILGNPNPYSSFFEVGGRRSLEGFKNFLLSNTDVAKEFIKGKLNR